MLKLLKTIMRAGTATVKYPFAPLEVSPGFRGKPDLMPSLCLSGKCADYPDRLPAKYAHLAALSGTLYLLRTL